MVVPYLCAASTWNLRNKRAMFTTLVIILVLLVGTQPTWIPKSHVARNCMWHRNVGDRNCRWRRGDKGLWRDMDIDYDANIGVLELLWNRILHKLCLAISLGLCMKLVHA